LLVAQKDFLIWVLVGIALASAIWTVAPDITLRRSLLLLGTTLFGIYLAMRYSLREQLQLLSWALGLVILLSIVFAIGIAILRFDGHSRGRRSRRCLAGCDVA
jgi:hypothetical protein